MNSTRIWKRPSVVLAKAKEGRLWRGEWAVLSEGESYCRVVTRCIDCGRVSTLAFLEDPKLVACGHCIDRNGIVSPSVVCKCGRHSFLELDDWDPKHSNQETYYANYVYKGFNK